LGFLLPLPLSFGNITHKATDDNVNAHEYRIPILLHVEGTSESPLGLHAIARNIERDQ
jgi:hypothetical protein